jgi:hypothetical protein
MLPSRRRSVDVAREDLLRHRGDRRARTAHALTAGTVTGTPLFFAA